MGGEEVVREGKVVEGHEGRVFTLATSVFVANGKDGYEPFGTVRREGREEMHFFFQLIFHFSFFIFSF